MTLSKNAERLANEHSAYVDKLKQQEIIALDVPTASVIQMIDLLIWGTWYAIENGSIARNDAPSLAHRTLISGLSR